MSRYIRIDEAKARTTQLFHGYEVEQWLESLPSIDIVLAEDVTLVVSVEDATKVKRVLVEDGNYGDLYYADKPQEEFTKREYEQFLHGISLSLLSKRSAQHWGYEEETAQKIRWLEALEQKVRAKMKGADDE